ncbi:MAG: undecaprenyl/decaprenyl-phosphate alpha-N-acetylglucosaminyl 1-phosphate transferase [Bacteroidales bacterium]|nr:undecaprenyl/decaprenyl-phosphate alpha-N-acetylglucosaminyl 1-phosphate transferase [Bacteroidales bacterium]MCF8387052.1 undecaprenyl/decaprenyl-phosphate alpha-N-acetylglucosaminyl 1-phosphate transferase [Bacteroidales bacterium]MCF8397683.1 undecaprenyl/decaprenyl-phosphate alpha-N-acetylglucosaminyl 1-phosphate transferase [Bacteroidales bacterium]
MNYRDDMAALFQNYGLLIFASFLLAALITYVAIPTVIDVARAKRLFDEPNGRGSHTLSTPTLGGLAIFAGYVISSMIFINIELIREVQYVIAGSIIIFFIGLKDDIIALDPLKKLIGQIIAAGIIIDLGNIRIASLQGFMGIYEIDYFSSAIFSLFVVIVIINAFNLIDGIDGLASGIGILTASVFGFWFYLVEEYQYSILAASLVGALSTFFLFNVFGHKNKIFMGDTGSLLLGFFSSVLALKFIDLNSSLSNPYNVNAAPTVAIGILIVPLFDTLRVFTIRVLKRKSPFKPDRQHVHHRLLTLGNSHIQATSILLGANILFIALVFLLQPIGIYWLTIIILTLALVLSYIPVYMVRRRKEKVERKKE